MSQFKPMLAGKCTGTANLRYPVMASPKLDGVRAIVLNGVVLSRSLKPIPNQFVQRMFRDLEGYDGELIVGDPTAPDAFRKTTSGVMSIEGQPNVTFHVFDRIDLNYQLLAWDKRTPHQSFTQVSIVEQTLCYDERSVLMEEDRCLAMGYEGLMLRDPAAPYKFGRSTEREGYLLKLKRFQDSEAVVLGMEERMHNGNEATINALGHTERSGHQANLVGTGTMGALLVQDLKTDVQFSIGSGFDDKERARWWAMGGAAIGKVVRYTHFAIGAKDKPRFPIYDGERSLDDL